MTDSTVVYLPSEKPLPTDVVVEYDKGKSRAQKTFASCLAARAFYLRKDKAGKNPKIVSAKPK